MIRKICIFLILVIPVQVFAQSDIENVISYFAAKLKSGEVNLLFKVSNPLNINRITVESRKAAEQDFIKLDDIQFSNFRKKEETDSITVYHYSYNDKVNENGVYFYRITLIDNTGKAVTSDQIKLGISEISEFELHQNNPNPFNPSTTIVYELLASSSVKLQVYTLTGKLIDELVNANQGPGTYSIEFNADNYGDLSSGIYFYKLTTNYSSDIKKMILTK
jgi:hypothetical protein